MRTERKYIKSDNHTFELLVLKPDKIVKNPPGILWIHGGGYMTGFKEMIYFSRAKSLVDRFGVVVLSPGYRLAPAHAFPAAITDCYNSLEYLKNHSAKLGINPEQIMIGGESAGGGLAVATTLLARDLNTVNIAYQMPLYPMLSFKDTLTSKRNFHFPWNTYFNHLGWGSYLRGVEKITKYASPSLETDYSGLPPAYSFVGIKEPFYQETLDYMLNLKKCGIKADLDVYNTGFHAFDMLLPRLRLSKNAKKRFEEHFDYAQRNYFNPQNN